VGFVRLSAYCTVKIKFAFAANSFHIYARNRVNNTNKTLSCVTYFSSFEISDTAFDGDNSPSAPTTHLRNVFAATHKDGDRSHDIARHGF